MTTWKEDIKKARKVGYGTKHRRWKPDNISPIGRERLELLSLYEKLIYPNRLNMNNRIVRNNLIKEIYDKIDKIRAMEKKNKVKK